ncbi:MAG: winged helix-turn-helix transcriptional regulator, partial [Erysipelotrichaceae bacterium]|nr:winged helix-turn-helix transcriptional regulator [Erysipelotrichaceae bacterium]
KNCTLEEQAILNIIKENKNIKQEEIAQIINKSVRTVKTKMIEMQEKGLITRIKGKKNGEWEILL